MSGFDLRNPSFSSLLHLLPLVGPAVARTVEFGERFEELIKKRGLGDQAELRAALEDIRSGNDEGHARLQAKLAKAAADESIG